MRKKTGMTIAVLSFLLLGASSARAQDLSPAQAGELDFQLTSNTEDLKGVATQLLYVQFSESERVGKDFKMADLMDGKSKYLETPAPSLKVQDQELVPFIFVGRELKQQVKNDEKVSVVTFKYRFRKRKNWKYGKPLLVDYDGKVYTGKIAIPVPVKN